MITKILSLLFGTAATKTVGAVSSLAALGSVVGVVAWIFGPGKEWSVTLNALELSAVAMAGAFVVEWARRVTPPGNS